MSPTAIVRVRIPADLSCTGEARWKEMAIDAEVAPLVHRLAHHRSVVQDYQDMPRQRQPGRLLRGFHEQLRWRAARKRPGPWSSPELR